MPQEKPFSEQLGLGNIGIGSLLAGLAVLGGTFAATGSWLAALLAGPLATIGISYFTTPATPEAGAGGVRIVKGGAKNIPVSNDAFSLTVGDKVEGVDKPSKVDIPGVAANTSVSYTLRKIAGTHTAELLTIKIGDKVPEQATDSPTLDTDADGNILNTDGNLNKLRDATGVVHNAQKKTATSEEIKSGVKTAEFKQNTLTALKAEEVGRYPTTPPATHYITVDNLKFNDDFAANPEGRSAWMVGRVETVQKNGIDTQVFKITHVEFANKKGEPDTGNIVPLDKPQEITITPQRDSSNKVTGYAIGANQADVKDKIIKALEKAAESGKLNHIKTASNLPSIPGISGGVDIRGGAPSGYDGTIPLNAEGARGAAPTV